MCDILIMVYAAMLVVTTEERDARIRKPLEHMRVRKGHDFTVQYFLNATWPMGLEPWLAFM